MGVCIASFEIMTVIRGDQRDPQLPVHVNQALIDSLLLVKSIGLELEIETDRDRRCRESLKATDAEGTVPGGGGGISPSRQPDSAPPELWLQQGLVYAGFVIETLRVAVTDQANEVLVSETVLG